MIHTLLSNASFHSSLAALDRDLAKEVQRKGCPCGGSLHRADYPRSPLGVPVPLRTDYQERLSFCCSQCRKRITPPSVRFFGRRWYPAAWLTLVSILMLGISERRLAQVKRHLGLNVSEPTWKRWRRWWREVFPQTPFWQQARGYLREVVGEYPHALLDQFQGRIGQKLPLFLQWLAPLTGGSLRAV